MHYIVGIGNPKEEYEHTRHNAGKILVARLALLSGSPTFSLVKDRYAPMYIASNPNDASISFVLSGVFMNESGLVIKKLYQKPDHGVILVVHDDLDLSIGSYKLSRNKGDGGHNGISSIIRNVPQETILRLRLGISPKDSEGTIRRVPALEQADYVLKPLSKHEEEEIKSLAKPILSLLSVLTKEGADKAMTIYNR